MVDTIALVSGYHVSVIVSIELFAGKHFSINLPSIFKAIKVGKIFCVMLSAGNLQSSNRHFSNVVKISDHLGFHRRPSNDEELGYFLAGLIEGDGSFSDKRLEIIFHEKDYSLANNIVKKIGFGMIYKVRNKKAYKLVIRKKEGLKRVIELCNGKFVAPFKINQLHNRQYEKWLNLKILPLNPKGVDLKTHWLSGFLDADGNIGIFIANSSTHKLGKSVRLEIKISQKNLFLLEKIKEVFGGSISLLKNQDIYKFNITGNVKIRKMINYLDLYHLQSKKYLQFFILRKCFRLMEKKEHLTLEGLKKVYAFKERLQNVYK